MSWRAMVAATALTYACVGAPDPTDTDGAETDPDVGPDTDDTDTTGDTDTDTTSDTDTDTTGDTDTDTTGDTDTDPAVDTDDTDLPIDTDTDLPADTDETDPTVDTDDTDLPADTDETDPVVDTDLPADTDPVLDTDDTDLPLPDVVVVIAPLAPRTNDDLTASLLSPIDTSGWTVDWSWSRPDTDPLPIPGDTLPAASTARGQTWQVTATLTRGTDVISGSAQVDILNSPPTVDAASLTADPTPATTSSVLTCAAVGADDADDDSLTVSFGWTVNGTLDVGADTATWSGPAAPGDEVVCQVIVSDGDVEVAAWSTPITLLSTPPVIIDVTLTGSAPCAPFQCAATTFDPDGDTATLRWSWTVDGAPVPGVVGDTLPAGTTTAGQQVGCAVSVSEDELTFSDPVEGPTRVVTNAAPALTAVRLPAEARPGDVIRCVAEATDDCATLTPTYAWTVDGAPSPVVSATFDTTGLTTGTEVTCTASVTDGAHAPVSGSATSTLLATSWALSGTSANSRLGHSVAVLDDLDGDGLAEVAVGAPSWSLLAPRAGAVAVVFGRADVDASSLDEVIAGTAGVFVEGGSGGYDLATMACTPYVVSGCPTVTGPGELDGEDRGPNGAALGSGVAYAGDVDGDGVGDLITAAPYELVGNLWRGRTYTLSGARLDADALADAATFDGECGRRRDLDALVRTSTPGWKAVNADLLGWSLTGVGDANADGLGDFAAAAPNHGDDNEGTVFVTYGGGGATSAADLYVRGCDVNDVSADGLAVGTAGFAAYWPDNAPTNSGGPRWGKRLAPAGDFNGDGYDDVVVNSSGFEANNTGNVVFGGRAGRSASLFYPTPDRTAVWNILLGNFRFGSGGTQGRIGIGLPVGGGGDVNGDGFDDLAFVERDYTLNSWLNVLYGRATDDDGVLSTDETTDGSGRGFIVKGTVDFDTDNGRALVAPDLDGDGLDDVIMTTVTEVTGRGRAYVVYGATSRPTQLWAADVRAGNGGYVITGDQDHENLGSALAVGDVDGDGLTDVVTGSPGWDDGADWDVGRFVVTFGRDRRGLVDQRGGPEDDVLVGTAADETLLGGRGDDVLRGGGGVDVLYAGSGDDVIEVDDGDFRRVRGGRGEDTLVLSGVDDLDLTAARRRVEEVERFALSGQTLTLDAAWVAHASPTSNRVTVRGTSGALSTRPGDAWASEGVRTDDEADWLVLRDGRLELWVDTRLHTEIPPTVASAAWVIPEHSAVGAVVATVSADDPDGDDTGLRFALESDPTGTLAVDALTGAVSVVDGRRLDYEARPAPWEVRVRVMDASGLTTVTTFLVSVGDVPEAPVFLTDAPVWSVEEDVVGVIGALLARDVDDGDELTYVIVDDPSGLFEVHATTGDVSLKPGLGLDYETADAHVLTVAAVDLDGLSDEATVTVRVLDREVIEREARVTFVTRDWSIWDDGTADAWAGFTVETGPVDATVENCFTVPPEDAFHSENWSSPWTAGTGAIPLSFEATYSGTICTDHEQIYDGGAWSATVPVDVALSFPDEVSPGETFTLSSSATPTADGAGFWGTSSGITSRWEADFRNVTLIMKGCDSLFTKSCSTIVDRRNVYYTAEDAWGTPEKPWTAGQLDDPDRFVLTVAEPVKADTLEVVVDWDAYMFQLLSYMGVPSNTGRLTYPIGGPGTGLYAEFDYTIIQTDAAFYGDSSWVYSLEVNGVDASITFENGDTVDVRLGEDTDITVPLDGDTDGDGRVGVEVALSLDSTFTDLWVYDARAGFAYTGGYGRVRVKDLTGKVLAQKQVGPAFEDACAPKVSGQRIPITCLTSQGSETYAYRPSGFEEAVLLGGLDLTGP